MSDDFDWSPHTHYHRGDVATAREAAFFQAPKAKENCRRVLKLLREIWPEGLTDEEGKDALFMYSYQQRRTDLYEAQLVEPTDERRPSPRGRPMTVWRAVAG